MMVSARCALIILAFVSVGAAIQHCIYWPLLPEKVATHFGADGRPNDWMSRESATAVFLLTQIGLPVFLLLIVGLSRYLPKSMINVPHKDYWLDDERREATLQYMTRLISWIAVLTSLFMAFVAHLTFIANRDATPLRIPVAMTGMAIYLAAVFTMVGFSLKRFRRPA